MVEPFTDYEEARRNRERTATLQIKEGNETNTIAKDKRKAKKAKRRVG